MENVIIWYITDNENGEKIADSIRKLGLTIHLIKNKKNFKDSDIISSKINLFIFDLKKWKLSQIMSLLRSDERISNCMKFVILFKKQIKEASLASINQLHVEYISRKVIAKEFVLLLEKSIIVERYKEMMSYFSIEAEERIQSHESLMDIARKDAFESDKEKDAFIDIIRHEKHLLEEQNKLTVAIRDFTMMRQTEMFELKSRIQAEEMLGDLRRNELMDAQEVMKAQEAVLNFSSDELKGANKIIDATEKVQELSRTEALKLHNVMNAQEAVLDYSSSELDDANKIINATEKVQELSREEALELHDVMEAQEAVIDYSTDELKGANKIIDATEKVQELSRSEALKLHSDLTRLIQENKQLEKENKNLQKEIKLLKKKG